MSERVFKVILQQKYGTETQWNNSSYIPKQSEIIHYTDLNKIKIGDGKTLAKNLPFVGGGGADWSQSDSAAADYIKNKPDIKKGDKSYSIVEGYLTQATQTGAHAEGHTTHASGEGSHSEGYGTYATATGSHAEGSTTQATNTGAHAEGYKTTASGYCSHSEGQSTNAKGDKSHAEGLNTYAVGHYSHAEGNSTDARGSASHTEGLNTLASGNTSHAEGYGTSVFGYAAHVEGYSKNKINEEFVEESNENIIGIWTDNQFSLAKGRGSHVEGHSSLALGEASHAEGQYTIASGHWSHSEGYGTKASEQCSHAEGINTIASGGGSHAEGQITYANGLASHAEGYNTIASGERCHAEGELTIASGIYSHAEGYDTESSGGASHSEGAYTIALGTGSHAEGRSTIAMGYASHVSGKFNVADDQVTEANPFGKHVCIIGNGTEEARSNACAIDWDGNAYFKGNIYVEGIEPDATNGKKVATEEQLADYLPLTGGTIINPVEGIATPLNIKTTSLDEASIGFQNIDGSELGKLGIFKNEKSYPCFENEDGDTFVLQAQSASDTVSIAQGTLNDMTWHYKKWLDGNVELWGTYEITIPQGWWVQDSSQSIFGISPYRVNGHLCLNLPFSLDESEYVRTELVTLRCDEEGWRPLTLMKRKTDDVTSSTTMGYNISTYFSSGKKDLPVVFDFYIRGKI